MIYGSIYHEKTYAFLPPRVQQALAFARTTWPENRQQENRLLFPDGTNMLFLSPPRLEISSTLIRDMWRQNRRIDFWVPEGVLELMQNARAEIDRCWNET